MKVKIYLPIILCFLAISVSTLLKANVTQKICTTESRVDLLITKGISQKDTICFLLEETTTIASNIDILETNTNTIFEKACSIESITDNVNIQLNLIDSSIDTIIECQATAQSALDNVGSVDQEATLSKVCSIELSVQSSLSIVDIIDNQLDIINTIISQTDFALSYSVQLEEKWCDLTSTIDLLDATILSSVDVLQITNQSIETIQSKLDTSIVTLESIQDSIETATIYIPTIISHIDVIESKMCLLESKVENTLSLVDTLLTATTEINNQIEIIDNDFYATWTILSDISQNIQVVSSSISSSILDTITFEFDQSAIFTAIQSIESKACSVDSIIDALQNELEESSLDFNGVFTALETVNQKLETSLSLIDDVIITTTILENLQGCIGTPIYQSDIGTSGITISTSGKYYLAENIVYSPTVSSTNCIRITADNVVLDLRGKTISMGNAQSSTHCITMDATQQDNIFIKNGIIENFTGNGIQSLGTKFSNSTNFFFEDLVIRNMIQGIGIYIIFTSVVYIKNTHISRCTSNNAVLGFSDSTLNQGQQGQMEDVVISQCTFEGSTGASGLRIWGRISNIRIQDCSFINNLNSGIIFQDEARELYKKSIRIENCFIANNGVSGIDTVTSRQLVPLYNNLIKNNVIVDNGSYGIRLAFEQTTRNVITHNNISRNGIYGLIIAESNVDDVDKNDIINNVFAFNTFIENGTTNLLEESSATTDPAGNQGPNTFLGNFAYHSSGDASNYVMSLSSISGCKAIISQSAAFPGTTPTYWYNVSMTP